MQNNNPMNILLQMMQMGNNPQQIIQHMIKMNPQLQVPFNQMQQSNMSPKQYVMQYARQNNIDIQPLVDTMSKQGIKL